MPYNYSEFQIRKITTITNLIVGQSENLSQIFFVHVEDIKILGSRIELILEYIRNYFLNLSRFYAIFSENQFEVM